MTKESQTTTEICANLSISAKNNLKTPTNHHIYNFGVIYFAFHKIYVSFLLEIIPCNTQRLKYILKFHPNLCLMLVNMNNYEPKGLRIIKES